MHKNRKKNLTIQCAQNRSRNRFYTHFDICISIFDTNCIVKYHSAHVPKLFFNRESFHPRFAQNNFKHLVSKYTNHKH